MVRQHNPSNGSTGYRRIQHYATGLVAAFVAVEGSIRLFDLYRRLPWVDVPSHLLSGATVTALFVAWQGRHGITRQAGWAMVGNLVVALVWEVAEMIDELVTPDPIHLRDVFVWDGVGDIASALAGGLIFLWVSSRSGRRGTTLLDEDLR